MTQSRPVLIYNGGKFLLKEWVIENLPEHEIYVEPFGGAASVLMSKNPAKREVYNDLNGDIVNVFRVLRDRKKAADLERQLRLTPFAREEVWLAKTQTKSMAAVERARRTIVCAFQSRSRQSRDGAGMHYSKRLNRAPEADWATYPDEISQFTERLKNVVIENKPAIDIIHFWDSPTTLFYADPPYVHSSRNDKSLYAHELNDDDHRALLDSLIACKGMVVVSGYDSELYKAKLIGFTTRIRATKTSSQRPVTEVLWLNEAAIKASRQISLSVAEAFWEAQR